MAPHVDTFDPTTFPQDLIRYAEEEAARDADRVIIFLNALGLGATPNRPFALPTDFLLDLGAALRTVVWEQSGASVHLVSGLPAARDAVRQAFCSFAAGRPGELSKAVFRLLVERFAWTGRRDLRAEIVLDAPEEPEEDALVEAMAQFLWAHRHLAAGAEEGEP